MKHQPPSIRPNNAIRQGLLSDVVQGGYCVGCGACAAADGSDITMEFNARAQYNPRFAGTALGSPAANRARAACPFLEGANENMLARQYDVPGALRDDHTGWYLNLYAGHAKDQGHRERGSSGGVTSWLLAELLTKRLVDGVIHVRARVDQGAPHFIYDISTTREAVLEGAKTRYYPVELSKVIARVRATPGRFVFVGVPCFVKAVKRLMLDDSVLAERIVFTASLFCGHFKSGRFADSLAWQMGFKPGEWGTVDFRRKLPDRPASSYGIAVRPRGMCQEVVAPMRELAGHDWGMGAFRMSACDYCDDVVGEAADVSFGDAWLPAYVNDSAGTSLIIVRNAILEGLLRDGAAQGRLHLEDCSLADMVKSQEPSYRHRRQGLSYRLWLKDRDGAWRPTKRVQANRSGAPFIYRLIFRYRIFMSRSSHVVFALAQSLNWLSLYTANIWTMQKLNSVLVKLSRRRLFSGGGK